MTMKARTILSAAFGALALGFAATSAQAAPAVGGLAALADDAAGAGQVEKVTYGYGWRRHSGYGYGYYRPYKYYGYGYYRPYRHYGYYRPYKYYDSYGWRHWRHHHHW